MHLFPGNHYFCVCRDNVGFVDGKHIKRHVKKSNVLTRRKASHNNVTATTGHEPAFQPMSFLNNGGENIRALIFEFMNDHFSNARHFFGEKTSAPFKNFDEADHFLFKVLTHQSIVNVHYINSINELIIKIKQGLNHGLFNLEHVYNDGLIKQFIREYNDFFESRMRRPLEQLY